MFITAFVVCLRGYFLVLVPYATFFFQVSLFFVFTFGCHSRWRTCSSVRRSTPWRRLLTSVGQMWGEKHTTTYYLDHFIIFILVSTYKYFVVYTFPNSTDIISPYYELLVASKDLSRAFPTRVCVVSLWYDRDTSRHTTGAEGNTSQRFYYLTCLTEGLGSN
jgi:hypothetical protein